MSTPEIANLILVLADNKHQLGLRYAEWATGAPTLEAATAAAAMAQAELGHARALLPLLREFPARALADEDRTPTHYVGLLDAPLASWAEFVAANALFDTALTTIVATLAESSYAPLRGRARKIVEEERYHAAHGIGWLRQLGQAGGATQALIAEVVAQIWPETLCLFGPDDDPMMGALHRAGVIGASASELRALFLAQAHAALARAGLAPPPADALPWERWDATRRRLTW